MTQWSLGPGVWAEEIIDAAGDRWWGVFAAGEPLARAMFRDAEMAGAFAAGLMTSQMTGRNDDT